MNSAAFHLTEAQVAVILEAIERRSAELIAEHPDALHATIEQRRHAVGGMLELARRLNSWRLAQALEAHKDALRRQLEAL